MAFDPGGALWRARRRAGLTQQELASRTGLSRQSISRIECRREDPTIETYTRLLAACETSLEAAADPRLADAARTDIREGVRAAHGRDPLSRLGVEGHSGLAFLLLDCLRLRFNRYLLVGDIAARLHGAPVVATAIDVWHEPRHDAARVLRVARDRIDRDLVRYSWDPACARRLVVRTGPEPVFEGSIRTARVLRLGGAPLFVASIDDLISWRSRKLALAPTTDVGTLRDVQREVDARTLAARNAPRRPGRPKVMSAEQFHDTLMRRRRAR